MNIIRGMSIQKFIYEYIYDIKIKYSIVFYFERLLYQDKKPCAASRRVGGKYFSAVGFNDFLGNT